VSALGRRLRDLWGSFALLASWRSRWRLLRIKLGRRSPAGAAEPVELEVAALDGAAIAIRPGQTDMATLLHAFREGQHRPPAPVSGSGMEQICELGANIGTAVAALAHEHPRARLLAVEPDPANAALARRNLARFGERCRVLEAAVWDRPAKIVLEGSRASGLRARELRANERPADAIEAVTLDQVLDEGMPRGPIDYLHMCVEGTEPRLLAAGGAWPRRVRSIRVELYPDRGFGGPDCDALLEQLGFKAWHEDAWWGGYGFGVRAPG
jgi:FkbM family methyltransferase